MVLRLKTLAEPPGCVWEGLGSPWMLPRLRGLHKLFENTGPHIIFSEALRSPASAVRTGGRLVLRKSNKRVHVSAVLWSLATRGGACCAPAGTGHPALLSTACPPTHWGGMSQSGDRIPDSALPVATLSRDQHLGKAPGGREARSAAVTCALRWEQLKSEVGCTSRRRSKLHDWSWASNDPAALPTLCSCSPPDTGVWEAGTNPSFLSAGHLPCPFIVWDTCSLSRDRLLPALDVTMLVPCCSPGTHPTAPNTLYIADFSLVCLPLSTS